jgi:predicted transcriptional regulator
MPEDNPNLTTWTSQIVSAHVAHNDVPADELPALIRSVYQALQRAAQPVVVSIKAPAIPVKQSIKPEAIACLDCGGWYKMLKRHIRSEHNLAPEEYRRQWGLPVSYPLVAPNYAKTRSSLAKKIGLGRTPRKLPAVRKAARKRA